MASDSTTSWQYRALYVELPVGMTMDEKLAHLEVVLDRAGMEGWELVSASEQPHQKVFFFKRPAGWKPKA